jgi:hypothetical protein
MAQEQQYSPVSFDGIVPQLDVGDPSSAFLDSVRFARAGMEEQFKMDARQMEANQAVERANQKRYYEDLQGLAELSTKAADKFVEYKNQKTKEKLSQVWADAFVEGNDIDEEKLYADYNSDEQAQSETAQVVGEGLSQNLNKMKDPSARDIADATKLRKYTGLEATVALNAKAEAAMQSYGPALSKWLGKVQPDPGAGLGLAINEFNRRWADATGLSQANPGYTAKRVYPTLRREAAGEAEAYTRGYNAAESAKTRDMLTQQLADGEIGMDSYFKQAKGLTKGDGKTLMNNDDVWASLKGKFTPDQLSAMGQETFAATKKPYSEHPRFNQLMTEARSKQNQQYNLFRAEQQQDATNIINSLGTDPTKEQIDDAEALMIAQGVSPDIAAKTATGARSRSVEAQRIRTANDAVERWMEQNPGKDVPISVIGNAPLETRQKYAGVTAPDVNAETTSELIRKTQAFKDFGKDFKNTLTTIDPDINYSSPEGGFDPANYNAFKSASLTEIVTEANALMFGDASMTMDKAFEQAKKNWMDRTKQRVTSKTLFDEESNSFKLSEGGLDPKSAQLQAAARQTALVQNVTMETIPTALNEKDYAQPPTEGRYSERVLAIGRRLSLRPKDVVDLARQQKGLPKLDNTPVDDALAMIDTPTSAKITALSVPPLEMGLRAQIQSGQRLTGNAKVRTVAVGKQLLQMGYKGIWQHPDFNYDSGYTGTGKERVGSHSPNSYHNYNEALDIGVQANGHQKLEMLYQYLLKNRTRFGIAELFYDPDGSRGHPGDHSSHVHVSFGGGD